MANYAFPLITMLLVIIVVQSQACESEKFAHCMNLPTLKSQLHYSYNATNASLSIAFVARPSKPGGWISWAINPNGSGMVGAQSFVAYEINGTLRTKTLNIVDYKEIHPGNLSFSFWNVSAEKKDGVVTLYASLAVTGNKTVVNQVWQVGPGTDPDGKLQLHGLTDENRQSKSELRLTAVPTPTPTPKAPAPAPSAPAPPAPAPGKSNGSSLKRMTAFGGFDLALISVITASMVTLCLF